MSNSNVNRPRAAKGRRTASNAGAICVLLLLLGLAQRVDACSCGPQSTVLEAYQHAELVVIARAVSVEKTDTRGVVNGIESTTLIIEKIFKGKRKVGEKLVFGQGGGGDCIWTFHENDVGREFLSYLKSIGEEPIWFAGTCGRSRLLEYASDDLLYLNNLPKLQGKTRISGTLSFLQPSPIEGGETIYRRLAGKTVRIRSKDKTYELTTNKDGVYEIYDLPPGIYEIQPEVPFGLKVGRFGVHRSYIRRPADEEEAAKQIVAGRKPNQFEVMLEPKQHAYIDFRYEANTRIRGTILDTQGNPLNSVCLKLLPVEGKVSTYFYKAGCTEKAGTFEIDDIPAGSYVLVINDDGKISSSEPFPTFYYAGVFDRAKATVITIAEGDLVDNLVVNVPRMEETIMVEGVLLYSDGKPVIDETVEFLPDGIDEDDNDETASTDSGGRFKIRILKGSKGRLFGSMYTYTGEFQNCPKLEKAIKQTGTDNVDLKIASISLTAERNLSGVELKFPFPGCKKAP